MAETKLKTQSISTDLKNGWLLAPGTFSYASASTINTSVDLTSLIQIGDKIRLNNTSQKFFVVKAITSSLITLQAGTTYTVANLAVTDVYFSKEANPQGFPAVFNFTVAVSSGGGTTPTFQNYNGQFYTVGRLCFYTISVNGTGTAGAGAYDTQFSMPFDCATAGGYHIGEGQYATDGAQDVAYAWYYGSGKFFLRKKNIYTTLQNSDLAYTTTRYINVNLVYPF